MKEKGGVLWKLPPREMSCQHFREIFPQGKYPRLQYLFLWWDHAVLLNLSTYVIIMTFPTLVLLSAVLWCHIYWYTVHHIYTYTMLVLVLNKMWNRTQEKNNQSLCCRRDSKIPSSCLRSETSDLDCNLQILDSNPEGILCPSYKMVINSVSFIQKILHCYKFWH